MAKKYAEGRRAWGICARGGHKVLLKEMVFDGRFPNLRVDPEWYEPRHPLEFLPKVEDPVALYRPSPEVIFGPTAPVLTATSAGSNDPLFLDVVLLLHSDGTNGQTATVDSSIVGNTMSIHGNGVLSTNSPKFGSASFFRPGSDVADQDWLSTPIVPGSPLDVLSGSADFTIEGWLKIPTGAPIGAAVPISFGGNQVSGDSAGTIYLTVSTATNQVFLAGGATVDSVTHQPWGTGQMGYPGGIRHDQWYHFAIQRRNGAPELYFGGVSPGLLGLSWQNYTRNPRADFCTIGWTADLVSGATTQCYVDEVRVTRGVARYSGTVYSPPTEPTIVGTSATLTWTPSETDISEIASYSIFRGMDGATPTLLITCNVLRDFLGGIIGVANCTTTPSVPNDDTGSVIDKVAVEDAPITYVDQGLTAGHSYCYFVVATPMGNNQARGQGPPSAPSNTACVTGVAPPPPDTFRLLTEAGDFLNTEAGDRLRTE